MFMMKERLTENVSKREKKNEIMSDRLGYTGKKKESEGATGTDFDLVSFEGELLEHVSVGPAFAHAEPTAQSIMIEVGHPFLL